MPSSSSLSHLNMTQRRPWPRWWQVCGVFAAWTLFSVFVFSRFSTLGDSEAYLTGYYEDDRSLRTIVITRIASAVASVTGNELLAQLVFSMVAATGVIYLLHQAGLHGRYRWPLVMILLVPNFGIWASVAGRESLFITLLGFFLGAVLAYYRRPRLSSVLLALFCVAGMIFIRAPYGLGIALFLAMFLLYRSGPRTRTSAGVQVLMLALVSLVVLACVWQYLDDYITVEVLPKAASYFTLRSDTTRTWVHIDDAADLFASLWWSLPLALIGPTPMEVAQRPMVLPFLLSGLVVFACLLHSLVLAFRSPPGMLRKILVVGWLPAVTFILIAYVPFGIYNPGSAIRYASSFLLFLVFPSLLLSAASSRTAATDASDANETAPSAPQRRMAAAEVR
jgi:hypothetical protein